MVIYKTTNLINGKFYIGKDTRNLNCYLGSGELLKRAIKKYGKDNFVKEILEICNNLTELEEREKYWIKKLDSINEGYNLTEGGTGGDTFSNNPNKEVIRNKFKKRSVSDEVKKIKLNNLIPFQRGENHPNYGKKQSQETKEKRLKSFQKNGFKFPMEGKKHTEETKKKISEKKRGKKLSKEIKEKMRSSSNKGGKQKIFTCPYCNKQGGNTMFRWHFEKCKNK